MVTNHLQGSLRKARALAAIIKGRITRRIINVLVVDLETQNI